MHLQQTKRDSRETGGPQYYFHNLTGPIKTFLRKQGAVRVALVTPYGATKTEYFALSKDRKFAKDGKLVDGKVGHDRIQQGDAYESIGESIRRWYNLKKGDFERIDIEIEIIDDDFYLIPTKYKLVDAKRELTLKKIERPLTFTKDYLSKFWRDHVQNLSDQNKELIEWSFKEICRVVSAHKEKVPHIQEQDLLRVSGPLKHLGVTLGPYVGKGYDCLSEVRFFDYPTYTVPVEIKRYSKKYKYQMRKYGKDELSRAIILCAIHDMENTPKNVDIIELDFMCSYIGKL
ncbi:MAG: hypothetical protein AB1491_01545 [Thermodesulfobacteriota bacterium]